MPERSRCPACGTADGALNAVITAHDRWTDPGQICWAEGLPVGRVTSGGFFWLLPDPRGLDSPVARVGSRADIVVERGSLVVYGTEGSVPFRLRRVSEPTPDYCDMVDGQTRWMCPDPFSVSTNGSRMASPLGFLRVAGPFRVADYGADRLGLVCEGCGWAAKARHRSWRRAMMGDASSHRCQSTAAAAHRLMLVASA